MSSDQVDSNQDDQEKTKKRFRTKEQQIRFYTTAVSLTLFFSSFTILVFLIPFVIDPAIASLRGDFTSSSVECRIVSARYLLGVSRCQTSWSSCREGCTRDIFECHQVTVEYLASEDQQTHLAQLYVNVPGCGYPPEVNCTTWFQDHSVNDSIVACHYSRSNHSIAVTHVDTARATRDLCLSLAIPLIILISSSITLIILYTSCCRKLRNRRAQKSIPTTTSSSYNSSFTKVPRKKHSKRSKSSKEAKEELPLFQRAQERFEDYSRTNSRDNLLVRHGESRKSWRRNTVKS